jgi:uncharacterized protein (TIGR01244 family)
MNCVISAHRYPPVLSVTLAVLLSVPLTAAGLLAPGVPNFHQVDEHLYRGAQPKPAGFQSLAQLGVKTVIDLRGGQGHLKSETALVEAAGMRYISVPMAGLSAPSNEQIAKVLTAINDSEAWPVFVHCRHGEDRTGTIIACYRISHDGWPADKALKEAREHGMSRVQHGMREYILHFKALPGARPIQ